MACRSLCLSMQPRALAGKAHRHHVLVRRNVYPEGRVHAGAAARPGLRCGGARPEEAAHAHGREGGRQCGIQGRRVGKGARAVQRGAGAPRARRRQCGVHGAVRLQPVSLRPRALPVRPVPLLASSQPVNKGVLVTCYFPYRIACVALLVRSSTKKAYCGVVGLGNFSQVLKHHEPYCLTARMCAAPRRA